MSVAHGVPVVLMVMATVMVSEGSQKSLKEFAENDTRPAETNIYKKVEGRNLRIIVCKPDGWKEDQKRPAMVWIHGGGWTGGRPEMFLPHMRYSAARGAVAIGIQYRLMKPGKYKRHGKKSDEENERLREAKLKEFMDGPSMTDLVSDASDAMIYIRSHASELGIDPERISVIGDSAGAHLACCLGTLVDKKARANAVIACSAIADMTSGLGINYIKPSRGSDYEDPESDRKRMKRARKVSPIHHIKKKGTSFLVLKGDGDWLKERPKAFYDALKDAGVDAELICYENGKHAFIVWGYTATDKQISQAIADMDAFLLERGLLDGPTSIWVP